MEENQQPQAHNSNFILGQLNKISESLAVNTTETTNMKESLRKIETTVAKIDDKVGVQNGRVRTLEDWSIEAKKIIEATATSSIDYKINKTRLWTAVALIVFFGGTIITLGVMLLDSKINKSVDQAFNNRIQVIENQ